MTNAFNDLNNAGPAYHLTEAQKIVRFETGLAEDKALQFTIQARATFDMLPQPDQTFDRYYNIFSALLNKYHTLAAKSGNNNATSRRNPSNFIGNVNTGNTSQQGRHGNRGRGSRRGGGRGTTRGGRGRGRYQNSGRALRGNGANSSFAPTYGNFVPEAKVYNPDVFRNLTVQQKRDVFELKREQGWSDAVTPPQGFTIDQNTGYAIPSNAFINAIRTATIAQTVIANDASSNQGGSFPPSVVNIPPQPPQQPVTMPTVPNTSAQSAGMHFGRQGSRVPPGSVTVGSVSINGTPYAGQVFDSLGNPLN